MSNSRGGEPSRRREAGATQARVRVGGRETAQNSVTSVAHAPAGMPPVGVQQTVGCPMPPCNRYWHACMHALCAHGANRPDGQDPPGCGSGPGGRWIECLRRMVGCRTPRGKVKRCWHGADSFGRDGRWGRQAGGACLGVCLQQSAKRAPCNGGGSVELALQLS